MTQKALVLSVLVGVAAVLHAADVAGRWNATFSTDIGEQSYTYEFVVNGSTLSGKATGSLTGESPIVEGKIDGETISFVEEASFMDMPIRITYTGKMKSADEIEFTRNVADLAMETLVAKRVR